MTLVADILMIAGALGAAFYCMVLSRRLRRFSDLDKGVGGAVAVLSMQVDDMNKTIRLAEKAAAESAARLNELTARSEDAARRLELMFAAMHDLPVDQADERTAPAAAKPARPGTTEEKPARLDRTEERAETTPAAAEPKSPSQTIFSSRRRLGGEAA